MRRLALAVLSSLAILPVLAADASAETCTFIKPTGSWSQASNWSCGAGATARVPLAADDVVLPIATSPFVTTDQTVATLALTGGDLQIAANRALTVTGSAAVTRGTIRGAGTLTIPAAAALTFDGTGADVVTITGGVKVSIAANWAQTGGAVVVESTGTILGGTTGTISGGTLRDDGSVTSSLTLTGGGALGGLGTVTGTLTNTSGVIRPATPSGPGKLTLTGDLVQGASGVLEVNITGSAPITGYDVLAVSGTATLGGTVKVIAPAYSPLSPYEEFRFLTAASQPGGFPTVDKTGAASQDYRYDSDLPLGSGFGARLLLADPILPFVTPGPPDHSPTLVSDGGLDPGNIFTCDPGQWTPATATLAVSWLRNGAEIPGETGTTHTLTTADALASIRCKVTALASGGYASANSNPIGTNGIAPANVTPPVVAGEASVGSTLSCTPGTWTGAPAPTFTYIWERDGYAIVGATDTSYTITASDIGTDITCLVNADNASGIKSAVSAKVALAATAPAIITAPKIAGKSTLGTTLTCDPGTWSGTPAPTLTYEWLRNGQPIAGQTQPTYDLVFEDGARQITCRITAGNRSGSAQATSAVLKVEKNAEQRLIATGKTKIATSIGLPSNKGCVKARGFHLTFRAPSGITIDKLSTKVNGKRNKTVKSGSRYKTTVNVVSMKLRHRKRFSVQVTIVTDTPRTIITSRVYKIC